MQQEAAQTESEVLQSRAGGNQHGHIGGHIKQLHDRLQVRGHKMNGAAGHGRGHIFYDWYTCSSPSLLSTLSIRMCVCVCVCVCV